MSGLIVSRCNITSFCHYIIVFYKTYCVRCKSSEEVLYRGLFFTLFCLQNCFNIRSVLNSQVDNEGTRRENKTEANVCMYTVVPLISFVEK